MIKDVLFGLMVQLKSSIIIPTLTKKNVTTKKGLVNVKKKKVGVRPNV